MHSVDEAGKPRYRAACDACRQSKVRCSGGPMCSRCIKHDYKCRYSIAHRAGKPKGSKNKATLKKLENLQALQQGKFLSEGGVYGRRSPKPMLESQLSQQRRRKKVIHDVRTKDILEHPSQGQMRTSDYSMPHNDATAYPAFQMNLTHSSPISESQPWGVNVPSAELPYYEPVESIYGPIDPSAFIPYLPLPCGESDAASSIFGAQANQAPAVNNCCCIDELHSSQRQLSVLDPATVSLHFDQTMDVVMSSLSALQIFLSCSMCPKTGTNLWTIITGTDRALDTLGHLFLQRSHGGCQDMWSKTKQQKQHQQQKTFSSFNYALSLQDCVLEQVLSSAYQVVCASRGIIETEIGMIGGDQEDMSMKSDLGLSTASSPLSSLPSPMSSEAPAQIFNFKIGPLPETQFIDYSSSPVESFRDSYSVFSPIDLSLCLRAVHRHEKILNAMRVSIAGNAALDAAQISPYSWCGDSSNSATNQSGKTVTFFQGFEYPQ